MIFRSEFGEDQFIIGNIELPKSGVWVDVGCALPDTGSNTAFLREMGWPGVAIDGNEAYHSRWGNEFVCAIVSNEPEVAFSIHANAYVSRVEHGAPLRTARTLDSILEERGIGKVDFLSLDVEGHEYEALLSINLEKHQPTIVVSEFNTQGLPHDFRVYDYLTSRGYRAVHRTFSNFIFLRA